MIPNRISFSISFFDSPQPVADVWATITKVLTCNNCLPKKLSLSQIAGHPKGRHSERDLSLSAEEITKVIAERALTGFWVQSSFSSRGLGFRLFSEGDKAGPTNLSVFIDSETKAPDSWNQLIEMLLGSWPGIGAWQWNTLYESWQACREAGSIERYFGSLPPGIKTFIEPPIDILSQPRELIDISLNPGRTRNLIIPISFHATAEMWLGPHFWQYAKCTKEEVLASDFFLEKRDTPHFLYIKSWPEPFTRPDGEQGRQQQRIWQLFFHEDCEWPPGSGGISDEPMFGPPELMP